MQRHYPRVIQLVNRRLICRTDVSDGHFIAKPSVSDGCFIADSERI
ncbi:hypothetical protein LMG26691_03480 [Achromobacter animicus]|nr:hypothetical protein LMG26691_03480 [Achromobacter animicus]